MPSTEIASIRVELSRAAALRDNIVEASQIYGAWDQASTGPQIISDAVELSLWVLRTPSAHSGNEPVLVDEPAKEVGSSDAIGFGLGDRDRRFGDPRGASLIEGSVGPMPAVGP